jgi:hypothetical protein
MKKNIYVKRDGVVPKTPFKKDDFIVYVGVEDGKIVERTIIMLDRIENNEIHAKAVMFSTASWKEIDLHPRVREWEDGSRLRYATNYEMKAIATALYNKCFPPA